MEREHLEGGRGSGELGRLLEGQIPSRSLSSIFQHLTSQFQMLSLGSSLAFHSWLGQSALNESQRGLLTMGRANAAWRQRKWVGKGGHGQLWLNEEYGCLILEEWAMSRIRIK